MNKTSRPLWMVSMVSMEKEVKMILDKLTGGKRLLLDLLVF